MRRRNTSIRQCIYQCIVLEIDLISILKQGLAYRGITPYVVVQKHDMILPGRSSCLCDCGVHRLLFRVWKLSGGGGIGMKKWHLTGTTLTYTQNGHPLQVLQLST